MTSNAASPVRTLLLHGVLAWVIAGFGCKTKGPESYVYSVFVEESDAIKAEGLELAGKPLTLSKQHPTGKSFQVTLPASELLVEKTAAAVMKTTCGAVKLPGTIDVGLSKADTGSSEQRERGLLAKGANDLTARFVLTTPLRLADVYVDVDGAAGVPVTVGTITVDPNKRPHRLPLGTCATGNEVKVGGASVGTLSVVPRKMPGAEDLPGTAFVDAKGGRCYEKKLHVYVDKEQNAENMARSAPERLEAKRVYALEIDDFLVPSPERLTSKETYPMRTEVRRCTAAAAPAGKAAAPKGLAKPRK